MVDQQKSNWRAALAVFWGFFGVRKQRDYDADAAHLTPAQVIIAGLVGGALFVGMILLLVMLVAR
ncbi:MAG TPA: DUF2970 domain-containing protein [Thiobacillaceae bacterium]|nr:DUF2970 domain-containing protein [Thiobacillaceae bacterium]